MPRGAIVVMGMVVVMGSDAERSGGGRAEAMPRGRRRRGEGMTSGRDGERAEAMPRDGKAARGRDAEGKGWRASGASSASERHDYG